MFDRRSYLKVIFAACFLAVLLMATTAAAVPFAGAPQHPQVKEWNFENFDSAITVNKDGSVTVREKEIVNFTGSFSFLNRDLLTSRASFTEGRTYGDVRYKNIKVYDLSGNPYSSWKIEKGRGYKRVHIDFSAMNEQKGWIIEYTMTGVIIYAKDYDRLYFNTVSVDRDVPVKTSNVMVTLPPGTDMSKVKSTAYPSASSPPTSVTSSKQGNTLLWETKGIAPQTTLTVDVSFPKGVVQVPLVYRAWFGILVIILAALLILVIGGGMIWMWNKKGRDIAAPALDVVQYEPPEGLRPAEVGMLMDEIPRNSDVTATIVDLAIRGQLVISEGEASGILKHKEYSFESKGASTEGLEQFETDTLTGLFESGSVVTQEDLKDKFYTHLPIISTHIKELVLGKEFWDGDPASVKRKYFYIGILLLLLMIPVYYARSWFDLGYLLALMPALGISGIVVMIVGHYMPRRTEKGAQMYSYIMGFKDYLSTAEKEEMKFMTPENFQTNLPYAMVLGVTQQWAEKFKDIYTSPPDWYRGYYGTTFSTLYLADSLNNMQTSVYSTLSSSPSSSSSGGGGGFGGGSSGGGFGGGGSSAG
jgi:Predicted membrane protein (DUF2207)